MILNKITTGFVVQKFDSETGRCLSQEFIASDQVEWEDQKGDRIEDGMCGLEREGFYFPLKMKQPDYEGPREQEHDCNGNETDGDH